MRQKVKFVFGNEDIVAEVEWCEDSSLDIFNFEWDGKTYEGYVDLDGNKEYKTLIRV